MQKTFHFEDAKNFPFLKVQNSFHLHSIWSYELKLLTNVNVQKSVLFLKVKVKMQISFHLQGCLFCLFYFVYEDEDEGEDAKNYTKAFQESSAKIWILSLCEDIWQ